MRVGNQTALRPYSHLSGGRQASDVTGVKSFGDMMRRTKSLKETSRDEPDAASSADVPRDIHNTSWQDIRGFSWTDEKLAFLIGGQDNPIDTTKTINWGSKGENKLTAEQTAELSRKYNVENLTPQSYYDLMCDLTNLGVVSAEACVSVHLSTFAPGIHLSSQPLQYGPQGGEAFTGNVFERFSDSIASIMQNIDWANSDKFDLYGTLDSMVKDRYRSNLDSELQNKSKVFDILQQLKR